MVLTELFVVIALSGCAIEAYLILKLHKEIEEIKSSVVKKVDDLNMETKLKDFFEEQGSEDLHKLTAKLFDNVKSKFKFKASSYSELINEIKRCPQLQGELGEILIDFFGKVNRLFYMKGGISNDEKDQLKKETRVIIKKMHNI